MKTSTNHRLARSTGFPVARRVFDSFEVSVWNAMLEKYEMRLHSRLRFKIQVIAGFSEALRSRV